MARDTGIPSSAPGDDAVSYHFGAVNQDSTCSASGAERYRPGDNVFSGERTDRIPDDEYGAE